MMASPVTALRCPDTNPVICASCMSAKIQLTRLDPRFDAIAQLLALPASLWVDKVVIFVDVRCSRCGAHIPFELALDPAVPVPV